MADVVAAENLKIPVVIGNGGYLVFFDNVRVDQFVTDYSVNMGVDVGIGSATINMVYVPDFDKRIHEQGPNYTVIDGATYMNGGLDDGIENMTNVRIFVKNIFNGKYVQIFGGNITGKSTTISGGQKKLSFQAQDFMYWLTRTVCPIAVPFDGSLSTGDRLKWKAQGIKLDSVSKVHTSADVTFKGKTLSQTWQEISNQTLKSNGLYYGDDTVSKWDDALSRVVVMGDIDENLRKIEVIDFVITSSITSVDSTYVMINNILKSLMFEFYQDRDETIRIKPPFWNEHVLKNHVIDPALILSYTESSNFSQMYTRTIATGALDEWHSDENASERTISLITPVVAVTSGGTESNTGCLVSISASTAAGGASAGSDIAQGAVAIALQQVGKPYIWGTEGPSSYDCSGLIDYVYRQAGYVGFGGERQTTYTLINKGREVQNLEDVIPGDIILPSDHHVYMAISKTEIVEAQQSGTNVLTRAMPSSFWHIRRLVESDGVANIMQSKVEVAPDSVGEDTLLQPTYLEKKFGPLIYECSQPLIKFSTANVVAGGGYWASSNHGSAYWALAKYARYMINYLNSSVTVASVQTMAMPWIRPGFNVWIDPVRVNKIFYVNSVNHYGNASGNYTSLNMSFGRRKDDFVNNANSVGGLKPGKSDDIFVNTLLVTPTSFGEACNYAEVSTKVKGFYSATKTTTQEVLSNDPYFEYFYSNKSAGTAYAQAISEPVTTTSSSGGSSISNAPTLDRLLKVTSPMLQGEDVTSAQNLLNNAGYSPGNIDGWYGPQTQSAVMSYQTDNSLSVDGQIGPLTWAKLTSSTGGGSTSASSGSGGGYGAGTVHVSSIGLCVRTGPGTNFGQIGSLWDGDTVQIIAENDGWYNIVWNGADAWSSANYITKTSEPASAIASPTDTPPITSQYSSSSSTADLGSDMTIEEVQLKLNQKYALCTSGASQNKTVSDRIVRLATTVKRANDLISSVSIGRYADAPFAVNTGFSNSGKL